MTTVHNTHTHTCIAHMRIGRKQLMPTTYMLRSPYSYHLALDVVAVVAACELWRRMEERKTMNARARSRKAVKSIHEAQCRHIT